MVTEKVKEVTRWRIGEEQVVSLNEEENILDICCEVQTYIDKSKKFYPSFMVLMKAYERVDRKTVGRIGDLWYWR